MPQNRFLVRGQDAIDAIETPVVGIIRIWRVAPNTGDPPDPTDLYLVIVETPETTPIPTRAKRMPQAEVAHVDGKIAGVFKNSGLNLLDFGPAMGSGFSADIVVARTVAARLEAVVP